ncbi:MAG: InlB B-repeat-containing protein [Treponema sp.]|jgi:hypothetical protein|nr:InlB B-repeat-containing protein [Treponema sp.]
MLFTTLTPIAADITVYAKWGNTELTKYTVTFDPDGGSVNPTSIEVNEGYPVGSLPTPTKDNNSFGGWWTAQNGGGTQFVATTTVNGHIKVYAKWTAIANGQKVILITGLSGYNGKTVQVRLTDKGDLPLAIGNIIAANQGGEVSNGNVALPLYLQKDGNFNDPWADSGSYFVLVVINQSSGTNTVFASKQKIQFTSTTTEVEFSTNGFTQLQ